MILKKEVPSALRQVYSRCLFRLQKSKNSEMCIRFSTDKNHMLMTYVSSNCILIPAIISNVFGLFSGFGIEIIRVIFGIGGIASTDNGKDCLFRGAVAYRNDICKTAFTLFQS